MLKAICIGGLLLATGMASESIMVPLSDYRFVQFGGTPESGRQIVERYCRDCHSVRVTDVIATFPPAPAFETVPADTYDRESLTVILVTRSHPDSLRAILDTPRLDDLLAYLRSLRDDTPDES